MNHLPVGTLRYPAIPCPWLFKRHLSKKQIRVFVIGWPPRTPRAVVLPVVTHRVQFAWPMYENRCRQNYPCKGTHVIEAKSTRGLSQSSAKALPCYIKTRISRSNANILSIYRHRYKILIADTADLGNKSALLVCYPWQTPMLMFQ